jgi:hypothetical protein
MDGSLTLAAGEVRPDGRGGFEVVIEVSEIVWEPIGEHVVRVARATGS